MGTRWRLNAFLDHELEERDAERVRLHLAGCRHCRDARRRLEATLNGLHATGTAPVPPVRSVVDRVMAIIRNDETPK